MLEQYSVEEKRELLRLARIRLGIEIKVPRENAIDYIVERGMFSCLPKIQCTSEEINESISSLGLMRGLRSGELIASLERLQREKKIEKIQNKYQLDSKLLKSLNAEVVSADLILGRIVNNVYKSIISDRNRTELTRFFLDFISTVFARLGEQWIKVLCNQASTKDFLKEQDVHLLYAQLAKKHALPKKEREYIRSLSMKFFEASDPEYNLLKFNLAQSFYITKILGIDVDIDLFSQKVFSGANFYLDSNIIFSILLVSSKFYPVVTELLRVSNKVGMSLKCSYVTAQEVNRVVTHFEESIKIFDSISPEIAPKVKGVFFESYLAEKKKNPSFVATNLFIPFRDLTETLRDTYSIEMVDDSTCIELEQKATNDHKLKKLFDEKSMEIRHRDKSDKALAHDVFHYYLIENDRSDLNEKTYFLTSDMSLPHVAAILQKKPAPPFCLKLDALMQLFSLFVTDEKEIRDFSEVFSTMVSNQLFPMMKLFDIRDFMMFEDMGMDIKQLSPEDVEEALQHVKKHVLNGGVYSHVDASKVTYELKKLFLKRAEKDELIKAQLENIEALKKVHVVEISEKDIKINALTKQREEDDNAKRISFLRRNWIIKVICFAIISLSALWGLICLTIFQADGANFFQKIINSWALYLAFIAVASFLFKLLMENDIYKKETKIKITKE